MSNVKNSTSLNEPISEPSEMGRFISSYDYALSVGMTKTQYKDFVDTIDFNALDKEIIGDYEDIVKSTSDKIQLFHDKWNRTILINCKFIGSEIRGDNLIIRSLSKAMLTQ